MVFGVDGGLGAVGGACLVEDIADVAAHRVEADDELVSDLLIATAGCDQVQYFPSLNVIFKNLSLSRVSRLIFKLSICICFKRER